MLVFDASPAPIRKERAGARRIMLAPMLYIVLVDRAYLRGLRLMPRFNEIAAGGAYALLTFITEFVLGAVRVMLVVPHVGTTLAVALEAPMMLIVSWYLSRWSVKSFSVF